MWKTIWECFSVPVKAIKTGEYMRYPVSRNPLSWIGMWGYGLLLIPFTIFVYPFYLALLWIGFANYGRRGNYAKISNGGIRVENKKGEYISFYKWGQISEVTLEFEPPCFYPGLRLLSGEIVHLHCANADDISSQCKSKGIKVYDKSSTSNT